MAAKEDELTCYNFSVWVKVLSGIAEDFPYRKRGRVDKVRSPSRQRPNEKENASAR